MNRGIVGTYYNIKKALQGGYSSFIVFLWIYDGDGSWWNISQKSWEIITWQRSAK